VREKPKKEPGVVWEALWLNFDAQPVFPSPKAILHGEPANMSLLIDHRATTCNANPIQILQKPEERLPTLTWGMICGLGDSWAWVD
jgi:hypothetical protein